MRQIIVEMGDDDSRRRKSGGAAVVLIGVGLLFFAAWKNTPEVITKTETMTVTQTVAVTQTTTSSTPVTAPPTPTPTPARLGVDHAVLRFTEPAVQFVRIENLGDEPLTVAPAGGNASFRLSSGCTAPLAKNASCLIGVAFDPAASGSSRTTLTINSNGGTAAITLIGQARPRPPIELQPIDFGKRQVGASGETRTLRLSNTGQTALLVGAATTHAPFNIVNDGCAKTGLGPGAGCDVTVDYHPDAPGPQRDELQIVGTNGALLARASLSGYGYAEEPVKLVMTPPAIDFTPLQQRRVQTIMVSNPGPRTAVIRDVQVTPNNGAFRVKSDCPGRTFAPNEKPCRIDVYLTRPILRGAEMAKVDVIYDGGSDSAGITAHR